MASFNRVILAGNLTRDPALSYTPSNTPVCEFGIATNRKFKDKDGNQRDEVTYVDCQVFGKTAELVNQYFSKGKPILVEGRLRYRDWTNKEGQKRNKLDVLVETFTFIEGAKGEQRQQAPQQDNGAGPPINDDPDMPF